MATATEDERSSSWLGSSRLLLMRPNQATCCLSRPDGVQSASYCPSVAGQGGLEKSDSVFHLYHHFERVEEDTLKPGSYLLLACLQQDQ